MKILLIDDNETFLHVAVNFLHRQASVRDVMTATRVLPALSLLVDAHPNVILLDMDIPEVDGLSAIPLIRQIDPGVPIVMLSVLDTTTDQLAAERAGAIAYVSKHTLHNDLMPVLNRVCRGCAD